MTKEIRNPNVEQPLRRNERRTIAPIAHRNDRHPGHGSFSSFIIRHSLAPPRRIFDIRISSFVIPSPPSRTLSTCGSPLVLLALATLCGCADFKLPAASRPAEENWAIVRVAEGFDLDEPGDAWTFRTPRLWRIAVDGDRRFLQMAYPPERPLLPGVRRPQEYAVYNKFEFRSFSLACYVRIDRDPSVKGRDACIIFCRRDDTHFYYAHLSNFTDDFHNNLIRVDGDTRRALLPADANRRPAITDQHWHLVEVIRYADAGTIRVFVDRDKGGQYAAPLFEATDKTYDWGTIALASFDDHASFGRLAIEGQARPATTPPTIDRPATPAQAN